MHEGGEEADKKHGWGGGTNINAQTRGGGINRSTQTKFKVGTNTSQIYRGTYRGGAYLNTSLYFPTTSYSITK